jgi:ribonuclease HI
MKEEAELFIYTDGGSRGNPGPSAIGVIVCDGEGRVLVRHSEYIGEATNNRAEYTALVRALELASRLTVERISCFLDSELVVRQMKLEYRVKNPHLKRLFLKIRGLESRFVEVTYSRVPRTHRMIQEVDSLVNKTLDENCY